MVESKPNDTYLHYWCGQCLCLDSGIGPIIVNALRDRWSSSGFVRCVDEDVAISFVTLPFVDVSLFNVMMQCDIMIVVDAVYGRTSSGLVHYEEWQFDADQRAAKDKNEEINFTHGFGVRKVLRLAGMLGRLPKKVILCGIEIASRQSEEGLSTKPKLKEAEISGQLCRDLQTYIAEHHISETQEPTLQLKRGSEVCH